MYYGVHGAGGIVDEVGGRERENRERAHGATRLHIVGYLGGCDQEEGEIECPCRH